MPYDISYVSAFMLLTDVLKELLRLGVVARDVHFHDDAGYLIR